MSLESLGKGRHENEGIQEKEDLTGCRTCSVGGPCSSNGTAVMSWCALGGRRISWLFIVNAVVGLRPRCEIVMGGVSRQSVSQSFW
jgi:hypothetical protein